ncbi:MAG: type II toxin-antitoxin system RelE/ParE family toxin [Alphaproteobacteria bacterium]|nr:type II toxin-antitoxin system RelE/ParE family toxin [Alphaproteobacteria bacterium]
MRVVITRSARRDLDEIFDYIAEHDSVDAALAIVERLESIAKQLARFPMRGRRPPEALARGSGPIRELIAHPYRIVYLIGSNLVFVILIADGRRNMQALLQRRLLLMDPRT